MLKLTKHIATDFNNKGDYDMDNPNIQKEAMFQLSYGLFVLTASDAGKDNGCIINTCMQITENPTTVAIAVNKNGLTHDMIVKTRKFNLSMLDESAPMAVFEHFGFQSGAAVNKFESAIYGAQKSENGIYYLNDYTNGFLSAYVTEMIDMGTHTLFIATVVKAQKLGDTPSATYAYYFKHIKPAPAPKAKGWICKICGYVYEGEELPPDYICPLCKHPASDFEKIV